uniref:Uncharacterized protein n=1 Tax=Megaselia scalaris TaxID=36166 RepID=T1GNB6_MEGSC
MNLQNLNKLGSSHLITVDFSHNIISEINLETFDGLENLKFLDLSFNKISKIPSRILEGIQNLETLNLSHNCLDN